MRGGSEVPTELARRFVAVDCAKLTVADIDSIATWLRLELSGATRGPLAMLVGTT